MGLVIDFTNNRFQLLSCMHANIYANVLKKNLELTCNVPQTRNNII